MQRHRILALALATALVALPAASQQGKGPKTQVFIDVATHDFAGMPSLDAKYAKSEPQRWPAFAAATSILPFGAILAGRNRLALRELGWWRPLLAVVLWVALIAAHPMLSAADPARYFH